MARFECNNWYGFRVLVKNGRSAVKRGVMVMNDGFIFVGSFAIMNEYSVRGIGV